MNIKKKFKGIEFKTLLFITIFNIGIILIIYLSELFIFDVLYKNYQINKVNNIVGEDLNSTDNINYPGVIYVPLPILKSPEQYIKEIEVAALKVNEIYVIPFSLLAQSCRTYDEYQQKLSEQQYKDIQLAGIGLVGNKKAVTQLIGHLPLFR